MSTRSTAGKPCAPRSSGGFFLLFSGPVRKVSLLRGNLRLSLFTSRARFKSCRSARHADKCSWRRADGKLAKVVDGAGSASPRAPPRRIYKIALYSEKGQVLDLSLQAVEKVQGLFRLPEKMPLLSRRCAVEKSSLRSLNALPSKAFRAFDPTRGGLPPPRAPPPQLERIYLNRGFLTS